MAGWLMMFRRVTDGQHCGVIIVGAATRGRLERCDVARNEKNGLWISGGADPLLLNCT